MALRDDETNPTNSVTWMPMALAAAVALLMVWYFWGSTSSMMSPTKAPTSTTTTIPSTTPTVTPSTPSLPTVIPAAPKTP